MTRRGGAAGGRSTPGAGASAVAKATIDPNSVDWPDHVSKVYFGLKDHIYKKYSNRNEAIRYAMFAMAYTIYCDEKKSIISKSIQLDANLALQAVKRPFMGMDHVKKYDEFDATGQRFFRAYIEDDLRLLMNEASERAKPGFWTEVLAHISVTVVAGILTVAIPALIAFENPRAAELKLRSFVQFLLQTLPPDTSEKVVVPAPEQPHP